MELNQQIKNMLTEDCAEILGYLEIQQHERKNVILQLIEKKEAMDAMENAILQLTRIFGAYAYKQTQDVELFKQRLQAVYLQYPDFKILNHIYLKEVSLQEINNFITPQDEKIQQENLKKFLSDIY